MLDEAKRYEDREELPEELRRRMQAFPPVIDVPDHERAWSMRGGVKVIASAEGLLVPLLRDGTPHHGLYLFDDGLLLIGHGDFRYGNPDCWWVPVAHVDGAQVARASGQTQMQ